jgi:hypothetical protein
VVKDADGVRQARDRTFSLVFLLLATALSCSIVVLLTARPVQPGQLPALRLDPVAVEAQRSHDQRLAQRAHAFEGDLDVQRLLSLLRAEGLAELDEAVDSAVQSERRSELALLAPKVLARLGPSRTAELFAFLSERAMHALYAPGMASRVAASPGSGVAPAQSTPTPPATHTDVLAQAARTHESDRGWLGSFPSLLAQYGYADADGRVWAPALAIRTFYKARLNLLCQRPADAGLRAIELQAYEGWNALHAGPLQPERRASAAEAFRRAGGHHGREAAAIWSFQGGARERALALLREEYARTGALRLRNMGLFALQAP